MQHGVLDLWWATWGNLWDRLAKFIVVLCCEISFAKLGFLVGTRGVGWSIFFIFISLLVSCIMGNGGFRLPPYFLTRIFLLFKALHLGSGWCEGNTGRGCLKDILWYLSWAGSVGKASGLGAGVFVVECFCAPSFVESTDRRVYAKI